ncbi:histone H2B.1/H2B.2-like [Tenrec ecaudatus]|uniref:histone H2B.1/H2B.2-like n=1 Tax=Tenrec ecaudatus TaxID=94439 RepID=UPI003F592A7F
MEICEKVAINLRKAHREGLSIPMATWDLWVQIKAVLEPLQGERTKDEDQQSSEKPVSFTDLNQVHPVSLVYHTFEHIACQVFHLGLSSMCPIITVRGIQTAVRLLQPGVLTTHTVTEGTNADAQHPSSK